MTQKEKTLYVRNARPNTLRFKFNDVSYFLRHRGSREDSTAMPIEAENDNTIARFLKQRILERITQDQFTRLAARTIDVLPNEYIKQSIRQAGYKELDLHNASKLYEASQDDTSGKKTMINEKEVSKRVTPNLEWSGDLMTTEEELEDFIDFSAKTNSYPSKHRDDDEARRKQMGY